MAWVRHRNRVEKSGSAVGYRGRVDWIYLVIAVAGVVPLVPTLLQSHDGRPPQIAYGGFAFAATAFGLTGAFMTHFATTAVTNLIAAIAVGLAAGAVHPEVLAALVRRGAAKPAPDADTTV
jgi:hypothetical protein